MLHVSVAGSLQNPTTSAARMNYNRIRREQRARLEALGECVCWVLDLENTNKMAILLKNNGTLFFLEIQRVDWICPFDDESLTNVLKHDPCPRRSLFRALTEEEVLLPRSIEDFPGFEINMHEQPNYGFSDQWQSFVRERAHQSGTTIPPLESEPTSMPTQSTQSSLTVLISVTSPTTSLKIITTAAPWMQAPCAHTVGVTNPLTTAFVTAGGPDMRV